MGQTTRVLRDSLARHQKANRAAHTQRGSQSNSKVSLYTEITLTSHLGTSLLRAQVAEMLPHRRTFLTAGLEGSKPFTALEKGPTWPFVRARFRRFLGNLQLTPDQIDDGLTKLRGVVGCLNRGYWGVNDEIAHGVPVGSWGKGTSTRPPRDIDLLFQLPYDDYRRFELRTGNRQSQLLQEVKELLLGTFPTTRMRGDGQVVVAAFNAFRIEVIPAFACQGSGYVICDTKNDGHYKWIDPGAELDNLNACDRRQNGNVRNLVQMFKQWQYYCDVPIKSFHLEAIVKAVLPTVDWGGSDEFWHDWLVRDVFERMVGWGNGTFTMPITSEEIQLGDAWLSKAETAYARALKACDFERDNEDQQAGDEWQKIFGTMIPQLVT